MQVETINPKSNTLLTIADLSKELHVSIKTIYYWVGRLEIPFLKIGRHLRFSRDEVLQYFKQKTEDSLPCLGSQLAVKDPLNKGSTSSRCSLKFRSGNLAET